MSLNNEIKAIERQIRKYGTKCRAIYRGCRLPVEFSAVVSDFVHKRGTASVGNFADIRRKLGIDAVNAKVIYAEYREFWDNAGTVRILTRGKSYDVVYHSIITAGDAPVYVMAIMEPVAALIGDYEPIEGDEYELSEDD